MFSGKLYRLLDIKEVRQDSLLASAGNLNSPSLVQMCIVAQIMAFSNQATAKVPPHAGVAIKVFIRKK